MTLRPAVFIDRDGTLTEEVGYVNHPCRLRLLPRAGEAIRRLGETRTKLDEVYGPTVEAAYEVDATQGNGRFAELLDFVAEPVTARA